MWPDLYWTRTMQFDSIDSQKWMLNSALWTPVLQVIEIHHCSNGVSFHSYHLLSWNYHNALILSRFNLCKANIDLKHPQNYWFSYLLNTYIFYSSKKFKWSFGHPLSSFHVNYFLFPSVFAFYTSSISLNSKQISNEHKRQTMIVQFT